MQTSTVKSLSVLLVLAISAFGLRAAIYKESGGIVVVEAEHFDSRTTNAIDHAFLIVPTEDPFGSGTLAPFINARGDAYVQILPDNGGAGGANIDPLISYQVNISTPGTYQLYLRWGGWDGGSDSAYASIASLSDGTGGSIADWYRYARTLTANSDFSGGWQGTAGFERTDASGNDVAATWVLFAGRYTIQLSQREDGAAVDTVLLQLSSLPAPADPGPAESATTTTFITVTQQPQDASIAPGQTATFTVNATGSATPTYQWQKADPGSTNFTDIAGATGTSVTTSSVTTADNGTRYRVVLSIPGTTITSRVATLTVDIVPPIAYRAEGSPRFDKVTVVFSEAVSAATGTNLANYSIPGLTIFDATLAVGNTNVILTTSTQTTGTVYTVTVKDIQDQVTPANTLSPNPTTLKFTGWILARGGVFQKYWQNISGNNVAALTGDSRFPDNPTFFTIEPAFEYPPNGGNEGGSTYGNQLSGWVVPPVTGDYVFFVCSDDPSELYLSHDANPANKHLIAMETSYSNARQWGALASAGGSDLGAKRSDQFGGTEWPTGNQITLTSGQMYYIEALHTEGSGGDNVGATWILLPQDDPTVPADGTPPIPGTNLFTYMNPDVSTATIRISSPTNNATFAAGANIAITVDAVDTNGPIRRVDFFAGANAVGSSTNSPFNITWNNVAQGRYTLTARALDRSGFVITSAAVRIVAGNPPPEALFVKDNNAGLNASDTAVKSRLESKGFTVSVVGALASLTSDADGKALIVNSSTVPSGDVANKFRNVDVPVINWEQALQDNYLFTLDTAADHATTTGQTDISIVNAAHPLAAGLAADLHTVIVDGGFAEFAWGVPNNNAAVVAVMTDDPTHATIYAYEKGAILIDGTTRAPARRVHFFMTDNTFLDLNTDGLKLFDAAVSWAANLSAAPPAFNRPVLSGGSVSLSWTGAGTLQVATNLTGNASDWSNVNPQPTNNTFSAQVGPTPRSFYRISQ